LGRKFESRAEGHDACLVTFWQGYVTGQFQAFRPDSAEPFLCSSSFRTWAPPWRPKVEPTRSPAARVAFEALAAELDRRGWRPAGGRGEQAGYLFVRREQRAAALRTVAPPEVPDTVLLSALDRAAGERGATSAEVGRALYGDDAPSVDHLPQRIGTRLRTLEQQGQVGRRSSGGVNRWFSMAPDPSDHGQGRSSA
jgi:hypothetical protein